MKDSEREGGREGGKEVKGRMVSIRGMHVVG